MRSLLFIIFFPLFYVCSYGQADTGRVVPDTPVRAGREIPDSPVRPYSQGRHDTLKTDSAKADAVIQLRKLSPATYQAALDNLLKQHRFINLSMPAASLISTRKQDSGKEYLFYLLSGLLLLFVFFKVFYIKYFNNTFRVFFNTSLRQNQLTDLLLQARLPSLIFNGFFAVSAGIYSWLLLQHYGFIAPAHTLFLPFCILAIACMYVGKFLILKFLGWATGLTDAFNTYVFVLFLVNKILGIVLLPFIIVLAFAPEEWMNSLALLSLLIVGIFFLLRFFRSYNLVQSQLTMKSWHFMIYIISIEVLPLLLVSKTLMKLVFLPDKS